MSDEAEAERAEKTKVDGINRYKRLFSTEDGKKILQDMILSSGVLQCSYTPDPYETAYNEGARSFVLRILKTLQTDPEVVAQLIRAGQSEKSHDSFTLSPSPFQT